MDGSSQRLPAYFIAPTTAAAGMKAGRRLRQVRVLVRRSATRLGVPVPSKQRLARRSEQVVLMMQAVTDRARAEWRAGYPVVLRHLQERFPSLPLALVQDPNAEPDPVEVVMDEFGLLEPEQQDKVAKNLALLWNSFTGAFGGVSGFQSASPTEQQSYIGKLEAAARRMEAARGTEAAFHYVTVELIRQYIAFLQVGSTEPKAVALARLVAPLIDRGFKMEAQPFLHTVGSRR